MLPWFTPFTMPKSWSHKRLAAFPLSEIADEMTMSRKDQHVDILGARVQCAHIEKLGSACL